MRIIKCLYCGKKSIDRGTNHKKKYCDNNCQQLWMYHNVSKANKRRRDYAKKYSEEHKKDPEYQIRQREYFRKWRIKNREHFNDLVRDKSRIYMKKLWNERKKLGLCTGCGKVRDDTNYKQCGECRKYKRGRYKNER